MGKRSTLILVVAWLGWVFDVMDAAIFNFAKKPMLEGWIGAAAYKDHGAALEGRIQMWFLFGWALGGLIFGVMADRWGRVRTLALTVGLYALMTGLTAACTSPEQVQAVRFLTGLGIGGEWAAGAALVAEAFADSKRPGAAAFLQTAAALGPGIAALLALVLQPAFGLQVWQLLFLAGLFPAVLAVFARLFVAESAGVGQPPAKTPLAELFSGRRTLLVLVLCLVATAGIAGAGNAAFWVPNLVDQFTPDDPKLAGLRKSQLTWIQHIGTLAGVFFFPWVAKQVGRRPAIAIGFLGGLLVTGCLWLVKSYESLTLAAPLMGFFCIGVTAIFGLYFPELFPRTVRATGAGFAYNTARILQAPVPLITGGLIAAKHSSAAVGMSLASVIYVIGMLALVPLPETQGKPLEADATPQP